MAQLLWLPPLFVVVFALAYWLGRWARTSSAVTSTEAPTLIPKRICANCQHFDLEEGQATIARYPNFLKASAALQPQEMGRKILRYDKHACDVCEATADPENAGDFRPSERTPDCHVCRGNGYIEQPVFEPSNLPAKARWTEFGACLLPGAETVLWCGDTCEHFVQLRAKS